MDLSRQEKQEHEKVLGEIELKAQMEDMEGETIRKRKEKRLMLARNQFEKNRFLPTRRQQKESLANWDRGLYYPYDFDKGFPIVVAVSEMGNPAGSATRDKRSEYERFHPNKTYSSDRYIKGKDGKWGTWDNKG